MKFLSKFVGIFVCLFLVMPFVFAAAAVDSATQEGGASENFKDLKEDHWAKDQIYLAVQKGYVSGFPDSTFRPDDKVTRAQFIRMLSDALKLPHAEQGDPWYQPYVAALVESGIHKEKDFKSDYDKALTRMEMARLAVRSVDTDMQASKDSPEDTLLMYEATKKGIIHGMGNGELAPEGHSTRAQAVAIIERILTINSGKTIPTDKYAMSAAELEYRHTNMETVFGFDKPVKLPLKLIDSPIHVTVEKVIVIDYEDPNALYRDMFSPDTIMNARKRSEQMENYYVVAFMLNFKNDKPRQGMYYFGQYFWEGMQYDPVGIIKETDQVKRVPFVRLEKEFEETYWMLMAISKEDAEHYRTRNGLVISIGRDGDDDLWLNEL